MADGIVKLVEVLFKREVVDEMEKRVEGVKEGELNDEFCDMLRLWFTFPSLFKEDAAACSSFNGFGKKSGAIELDLLRECEVEFNVRNSKCEIELFLDT